MAWPRLRIPGGRMKRRVPARTKILALIALFLAVAVALGWLR